jgi:hypothetical protein
MPRRNASCARRRNADRNRRNLLALAAAAEPPKRPIEERSSLRGSVLSLAWR